MKKGKTTNTFLGIFFFNFIEDFDLIEKVIIFRKCELAKDIPSIGAKESECYEEVSFHYDSGEMYFYKSYSEAPEKVSMDINLW